jgi:hypothetical protein
MNSDSEQRAVSNEQWQRATSNDSEQRQQVAGAGWQTTKLLIVNCSLFTAPRGFGGEGF